jgi:4'-phosphopantetheinyl transferase EntD
LTSLFPSSVIVSEANPAQIQGSIYPEEETFIQKAVPKRKQEFTAGRLCARRALAKIGISNFPILIGKDRTPIWPSGIAGSISHCKGYCGVAVVQKTDIESIALDVESVGQVKRGIWKHFCNQQELSWINSLPEDQQQKNAALIFSTKECFYKCQYPITKKWLNFHDVTISIDSNQNEFEVKFLINIGSSFERGTCLKGNYLISSHYVFSGMTLRKNSG